MTVGSESCTASVLSCVNVIYDVYTVFVDRLDIVEYAED